MKQCVEIFAAVSGAVAVMLGAFGAHGLKKIISAEKVASFETGVKYQMYHSILLLLLGMQWNFEDSHQIWAVRFLIIGMLLFSVSIYFLALNERWKKNLKWLGPITPLGGLSLIIGWIFIVLACL